MKAVFVHPPTTHMARVPGTGHVMLSLHENPPPLGPMYLSSYLKQALDADVRLFNFQTPSPPSENEFAGMLKAFRPHVVGISVMSMFWYDACRIAKVVKATCPDAWVVGGGAHMWVYPAETLAHDEFDMVVVGEGEITMGEAMARLGAGSDLKGLPGIWYKSQGGVVNNPLRPVEPDPDRFPFPDRSEIDLEHYHVSVDKWHPSVLILTSRGCPNRCTFCQNNDRRHRRRRVDRVLEEIKECLNMGYRSVDFYDDNLNQSRKHVTSLCTEMMKQGIKIPWACRARVNHIDRDLVQLMKEAGCERIHFGIESGNQEMLDRIQKGITVEQCREALSVVKEAGMSTIGFFIIGLPGETFEQAKRTISFSFELGVEYPLFYPLIPMPGTKIYEEALKDPKFGGDYGKEFALHPTPNLRVKFWLTGMTEKQILKLLRRAYNRSYFRPKFIYESFRDLSGFRDFRNKAKMALRILMTR